MFAIEIGQRGTAPALRLELTDPLTKAAVDVSNATVTLRVARSDGSGSTTSIIASYPNGGTDGVVSFTWPSGIFDNAGMYDAEAEIEYQNGLIEPLPRGSIRVPERLPA